MLLSAVPAQQTAAACCRHGADPTTLFVLSYNTEKTAAPLSHQYDRSRARAVFWLCRSVNQSQCLSSDVLR